MGQLDLGALRLRRSGVARATCAAHPAARAAPPTAGVQRLLNRDGLRPQRERCAGAQLHLW